MDADMRRLERLAETGDRQAEFQLAAMRDRLALPWSVDPRRDPVRRLLARCVGRTRIIPAQRSARYGVGPWHTRSKPTECEWRKPGWRERLYDSEAFASASLPNTISLFQSFTPFSGTSRAELPPMPPVPLMPLAPPDRVLLCYERVPLFLRLHTNIMGYPPPPVPPPFGTMRLQRIRRLRTPRMRVYAALQRCQRHEVDCPACSSGAKRDFYCDEYRMLAAKWRQANYDTHSRVPEPVFGMPVSLFPGPDPPPVICVNCQLDRNEWPRRTCRNAR